MERGEFRLTGASETLREKRRLVPVADYLKTQSRFRVITEEQVADVQARIDAKWAGYYRAAE